MSDYLSEAITVGVSLLGAAFGYGRLSQRVKSAEDKIVENEESMQDSLELIKLEVQRDFSRIRDDMYRENKHLEANIDTLRRDVFTMRDKLYDEISQIRTLLFEIKGRLEGRI